MDPLQPVFCEWQSLELGRRQSHGVDCRTDVVMKPGKSQFRSPRAPARPLVRFDYEDRPSGLRETDSGRKPVGPRTDHDGIIFPWFTHLRYVAVV